jgi:hypothetical protein
MGGNGVRYKAPRQDAAETVLSKTMDAATFETLVNLVRHKKYGAAEALKVLTHEGLIERGSFSVGWVNRKLRDLGISKKQARHGPRVSCRREQKKLNAEHQCDASPAASIYCDFSRDLDYIPDDPLLKGKQLIGKTPMHVFLLVEAVSRTIYLRGYDGERLENWLDFLYRGWCRKENPRENPFCGLPTVLRCDRGSGLMSGTFTRAMQEIGVKVIPHEAGQAWKKGKAERLIQHYQQVCEPATMGTGFKTRDEFNIFLERAALYLNNLPRRALDDLLDDELAARCSQPKGQRTALGVWRNITSDRLRMPPSPEEWARLCLREEECRIDDHATIRFGENEDRQLGVDLMRWPFTEYVGRKCKVYYTPNSLDPILVRLPATTQCPGGEFRVERLRPGSRPAGQLGSTPLTMGEAILARAKGRDLSHLDRTAHWGDVVEQHTVPQPGSQVTLNSASMFRRMVDVSDAITRAVSMRVFALEAGGFITGADRAAIDEIFAGRTHVEQTELDRSLQELKGIKEQRKAGYGL